MSTSWSLISGLVSMRGGGNLAPKVAPRFALEMSSALWQLQQRAGRGFEPAMADEAEHGSLLATGIGGVRVWDDTECKPNSSAPRAPEGMTNCFPRGGVPAKFSLSLVWHSYVVISTCCRSFWTPEVVM
jgi:hypothetical protein